MLEKLKKKFKNVKFTKKGVYISLAICMLVLGGIGIFSAVRNMGKIIEEADLEYGEIPAGSQIIDKSFFDASTDNEPTSQLTPEKVTLNFISPVGEGIVSKEYSHLELVWSETMSDYRTHRGVDILSEAGSTVVSSESGKIINVYDDALWGTTVEIEHANGFTSCYRNLADTLPEGIEVGSFVSVGGIIGAVGSTALVEVGEESHLHFEMTLNGDNVDPMEYISFN